MATIDTEETIRHRYFSFGFWKILEAQLRTRSRYSVRSLVAALAETGDYFEHHFDGGARTVYNAEYEPINRTPPDESPVVYLHDRSFLVVPYNIEWEAAYLWEFERQRYLHAVYESDESTDVIIIRRIN
jgi:hypothetical protein